MVVKKFLNLALAAMLFASATPVYAAGGSSYDKSPSGGPRKQIATIVFAGIAGAILGLSTLSFYGRPQEKLSNIAVGAAIGIIIGASYTTYKAATAPRDFYRQSEIWEELDKQSLRIASTSAPPKFSFSFQF